jgi:hypothetical protein
MRTGTFKDKGHYSRKAVFYAYAVVTLPVALVSKAADMFDHYIYDPVVSRGHKLHVWANPCLYAKTTKPPRKDGKDW